MTDTLKCKRIPSIIFFLLAAVVDKDFPVITKYLGGRDFVFVSTKSHAKKSLRNVKEFYIKKYLRQRIYQFLLPEIDFLLQFSPLVNEAPLLAKKLCVMNDYFIQSLTSLIQFILWT